MPISPLKDSKVFLIAIALAVVLAGVSVGYTAATHINPREICEGQGADWFPNPDDFTGTCWGQLDGRLVFPTVSTFFCAGGYPFVSIPSHDSTGVGCDDSRPSLPPTSSSSSSSGPAQQGKCKLLTIDSPLHIGTSFAASWIGRLDSIRFRQAGTSTVFVPPIAGSFHFEDGHRAGEFFTFGLDRGRWEATCFGPGGTFGTAKIVFVK